MTSFRLVPGTLLAAGILATAAPLSAQRGPAALPTNLPADVLAMACAPALTDVEPAVPLRVTGGQDSVARRAYAPGDLVTINAGMINGIEVGQEYFVRRALALRGEPVSKQSPATIHTAGWIRVYAIDDEWSLATITHACDSIEVGDYLEPFALPQPPVWSTSRAKPERDNYARVLTGADRRQSFGKGDFFTIDRGTNHGIAAGAQFVVYRDKRQAENFLYDLGEAVAIDVRPDTATLQVTVSRDAFLAGDYVGMRK